MFEKQFGSNKTESEVETLGSLQIKYPVGENFEPALEYYTVEHTQALGPVILGKTKFTDSKMKWEV